MTRTAPSVSQAVLAQPDEEESFVRVLPINGDRDALGVAAELVVG
jgi:hypothetical protein